MLVVVAIAGIVGVFVKVVVSVVVFLVVDVRARSSYVIIAHVFY